MPDQAVDSTSSRVSELERLLEQRTQERDTARRILAQQAISNSQMQDAEGGILASRLQTVVGELRRISEELEDRNTALATANWRLEQRVSERTAALEAALDAKRRSEARFRSVADNVPQLVWTSHPEGHWDFANQRWQTYTGQSAAEASDMGWLRAVHEDDRDKTMKAWHEASVSGRPLLVEHRIYAASGEWRWFETQAMLAGPRAAPDTRWVGSTTDIHARKLSEQSTRDAAQVLKQQLTEMQARYDSLFQVSAEALFSITAQTDGTFVHEAVNPSFEKLTGLRQGACAGQQASEFLPEASARALEQHYGRCLAAGQFCDFDVLLNLPIGTRTMRFHLMPMPADLAGVTRILGSARDISNSPAA